MFIDSDSIEKNSTVEADICVIGTGAAGISFALKFADTPDLKIVLLESGRLGPDRFAQKLNDLEMTDLTIGKDSRIRSFGGTTTVWAGRWKPLDPIDLQERAWVKYSGWPITRAELDPYYQEAASMFGAPDLESFKKTGQEVLETGELVTTIYQHLSKERLDFGKNSYALFASSKHIDTYLGANVLSLGSGQRKITGTQVRTASGNMFSVQARVFILACGGIENARLMLLSDIGNEHDQAGRYFMDHPKGTAGSIALKNPREHLPLYWGYKSSAGQTVGAITLSEESQRNNEVLDSCVILDPVYARVKFLSGLPRLVRLPLYKFLKSLLGMPKMISSVAVRNYMEQAPDPENRVTLSDSTDVFGNRLPKLTWKISELDKKTMLVLHETLKKELERINFGTLESPLLDDMSSVWPISAGASHHMGTTRMGDEPATSVVDKNCKVHSLDNLYVAGSSVFPASGSASPTATIVALALRLADHIRFLPT